ncbi:MAG TPA: M10 family metallopeptidase C-terminal domain-containing protein [Sphingomicrobium sp.]|nr:M10 family metallopeptidase C-terminal domain-containing protein [Sphingomicrobium sp.]
MSRVSNSISALNGSASAASAADGALPYRLIDHVGELYKNKPIYNQDQVFNQLFSGATLDSKNGVITYSFLTTPTTVGLYNNKHELFPEPGGYSPMSAAEQAVARQAIQLWDDLIPQSFVEKKGVGSDILFMNTTTGPAQAWAYYPSGTGGKYSQYHHISSDVWTADPTVNWTNGWLNYSGYGWTTITHELGHTLGLSHPGPYNYGPGFSATYENSATYAQDTRQYSIMSYWSASKTGSLTVDAATGLSNYPQTPMIDDIMAIQRVYGADLTTRSGDTVYGFNSNAGNPLYDFSKNLAPNLAIYDAGGNDTIDMSGANAGVFIDLRPGSFSSAATLPTLEQANLATVQLNEATDDATGDFAMWTQASYDGWIDTLGNAVAGRIGTSTGVLDVQALSYQNISIAYNTVIENAIGGSERDYLVGNDVANNLTGNGGNDVLYGLKGNDTLNGGAGSDFFVFDNDGSTDRISDFQTGIDKIDLRGLSGVTAADVTYNASTHQVEINIDHTGVADMFINSANVVNSGDYLFHA